MIALAPTANAQVSALFQSGVIAEYDAPNANRNDGATSFSDLNITSVIMSQPYSAWGDSTGTQGNDTDVFLSINFSDKASITVQGSLNWVDNDTGGGITYFGIVFGGNTINDGFRSLRDLCGLRGCSRFGPELHIVAT
jgi:hypothetical protein